MPGKKTARFGIGADRAANYHTNSTDQYEIADIYDADNCWVNKEGVQSGGVWSGGQMYYICPKIGYTQAETILPQVAALGFRGIHYIDVIGVVSLRRCYHEKHPVSYPESLEYARKLCQLATREFGGMSSEGAYDFIVPYLDYGLYISFEQGGTGVCHEPVPFWQLVYHGTVLSNPYADTVNSTFKGEANLLKLLEYGGRPSFYYYSAFMGNGANWMGNTDCICDTQEQLKSSVAKIKRAYDIYQQLGDTRFAYMQKHEKRDGKVVETTYSDGTVVQVDYEKMEYRIQKP